MDRGVPLMIGVGVSKWTMLHFGFAMVSFLAAQILMVGGWVYPADDLHSPVTLVAVHLLTIGWLSVLILGALYQFVPVMTTKPLFSQRLALVSLVLIGIGLAGMICGFLALAGLHLPGLPGLPLGGTAVVAGFVVAGLNLGVTLWRSRPLPLSARFVAAGLGFLLLTGALGLSFALAFALDDPPDFVASLTATGLLAHVAAGLGGWFSLTAMGVSYRLLSMFMLAPEHERSTSTGALWFCIAGLAIVVAAGVGEAIAGPFTDASLYLGGALITLGVLFYLGDMARLYRERKRRHLELNSIMAGIALAFFAAAVPLVWAANILGKGEFFAGPLGYLFIFGWLSGLGLSQLYKIVPFLTWLERFGSTLGKGPTPRVQDLVNEERALPWFFLYFVSVAFGAAIGAIGIVEIWRGALALQLLTSAAIGLELWRARRARPLSNPSLGVPGQKIIREANTGPDSKMQHRGAST